ncbi:sacsin N-terminal ATP-binding-like domain-containing protein [Actinophytocola sp.]|uniref:sacsin N-terminal ATP-binding-like domain-containing protein n=1 Tax=Actinophytocola sp. TaxID=1872138 RepID=UPI002ED8C171
MSDPFGTGRLREAVLASWRDSPTRFREDANAEEDLFLGGYRDRVVVELAQNASDAAGQDGILRVCVVGDELRVANTGRPLDADGVASLASLRASAKTATTAKAGGVGRFGVGFAAVLTVSDAPRVVSRTGGVAFSAARTHEAIGESGRVPVLRLVWPTDDEDPLPHGFDTEVRLPLRADEPGDLLQEFAAQAGDLLLSLDGLRRIEVGDQVWQREGTDPWVDVHAPSGTTHWLVTKDAGELADVSELGAEARPQWTVCWAAWLDDHRHPRALHNEVLHAPTPTDERLSLPARLIATVPIEADRRRVRPGVATDTVLEAAAAAYPRLLDHLDATDRTTLVPTPDFPRSEVDDKLRQEVLAALRKAPWLPTDDEPVAPRQATLLPVPSKELADALRDTIDGLVDPELAAPEHAQALAALETRRLTVADLVDRVTGIERDPRWWHRLYEALSPIADTDPDAREALGALPVPLTDGRTLPGPRGTLLVDADLDLSEVDVNVVHPDAAHPLLERLGARHGGAEELLDSLRDAVERSVEDAESGMDIEPLQKAVLGLVGSAGIRPGEYPWLAALAMRDEVGDHRRADELALPGSTFLDLLAEDTPLGVLDEDTAAAWPTPVLQAVGVLDSFAVVVDELPADADHELADEQDWWVSLPEPPTRVVAVRDLDLVADNAWPAALRLLAADPATWQALHQPGGYTGWWIAHHGRLAGEAPRAWRMPDAAELAGLYDPVPPIDVDLSVLRAIGVRQSLHIDDADDAEELLDRLGDSDRTIPPGAALRGYAALAAAVRDGTVSPTDVRPPAAVRALTGEVLPAAEAIVLNAPWVLGVVEQERVVGVGDDFDLTEPLAELLDLPLATEVVVGTARGTGEATRWADLGAVVDACDLAGLTVPGGGPLVHHQLTVRIGLVDHEVPWWVDGGVLHCEDSTAGLARALAWATDRWADRHTFAALFDDPENLLR